MGDGKLTAAELRDGITKAGIKEIPPDFQQILQNVDSDGSGEIDYTEFLAATLDQKAYLHEDVCWSAFRTFDRNGDGRISRDELREILDRGDVSDVSSANDIDDLLKEVDRNNDGHIDFHEFMDMMRRTKR